MRTFFFLLALFVLLAAGFYNLFTFQDTGSGEAGVTALILLLGGAGVGWLYLRSD